MHEVGLMRETLELALRQSAQHGGERILMVKMRIGELSGVVPEALRFAFDAMIVGTIAEHARLEIEWVPARSLCQVCGHEGSSALFAPDCPACGAPETRLCAGREIELAELEVD